MAQKPRVLVVDDELSTLALLTSVLEAGVEVSTATDGLSAVRQAIENPPSLVLLDADLPDISGFEVCRRLKAHQMTREIPVIFLTGYDDLLFEIQAFDAGAVDYVVKTVSPIRVLMRVRAHIKGAGRVSFGDITPLVQRYVEQVVDVSQSVSDSEKE